MNALSAYVICLLPSVPFSAPFISLPCPLSPLKLSSSTPIPSHLTKKRNTTSQIRKVPCNLHHHASPPVVELCMSGQVTTLLMSNHLRKNGRLRDTILLALRKGSMRMSETEERAISHLFLNLRVCLDATPMLELGLGVELMGLVSIPTW